METRLLNFLAFVLMTYFAQVHKNYGNYLGKPTSALRWEGVANFHELSMVLKLSARSMEQSYWISLTISKTQIFLEGATFEDISSVRMKLAWMSQGQPECIFEVSQVTNITNEHF